MAVVAIIWAGIEVPLMVIVGRFCCWSSFVGHWLPDVAQVAIMATTMEMMDIAHYTNIAAKNVIDI